MHASWIVAVALVGNGPYGAYPGATSYSESYTLPNGQVTSSGFAGPGTLDNLYPYEYQQPWLHGYYQEIPAYGGYHSFKPYNYKHLLSQSQTAAGFGMSPTMPYSQQFWHRYENRANLSPYVNEPGAAPPMPVPMPIPPSAMQGMSGASLSPAPRPFQGGPVIIPARGEADRAPEPRTPSRWRDYGAGR